MPAIVWTNDLNIGVPPIDTDHKLLVSLINQLDDAISGGEGRETVGSVINALLDYTEYHFKREESLMDACGYPDLEAHKRHHEQLCERVGEIRDRYVADKDSLADAEVLEFMRTWLTGHILGEDKKYMPFMSGKLEELEKVDRAFSESLVMSDDGVRFE